MKIVSKQLPERFMGAALAIFYLICAIKVHNKCAENKYNLCLKKCFGRVE